MHFDVIGSKPSVLRIVYEKLFGWAFDISQRVADAISEPLDYGFVDSKGNGGSINGGVGSGAGYENESRGIFYGGVDDVEARFATRRGSEEPGGWGPSRLQVEHS